VDREREREREREKDLDSVGLIALDDQLTHIVAHSAAEIRHWDALVQEVWQGRSHLRRGREQCTLRGEYSSGLWGIEGGDC
jgi:hypothetical protein